MAEEAGFDLWVPAYLDRVHRLGVADAERRAAAEDLQIWWRKKDSNTRSSLKEDNGWRVVEGFCHGHENR